MYELKFKWHSVVSNNNNHKYFKLNHAINDERVIHLIQSFNKKQNRVTESQIYEIMLCDIMTWARYITLFLRLNSIKNAFWRMRVVKLKTNLCLFKINQSESVCLLHLIRPIYWRIIGSLIRPISSSSFTLIIFRLGIELYTFELLVSWLSQIVLWLLCDCMKCTCIIRV